MTYRAKEYDHLLGTPGFSDRLLRNHFGEKDFGSIEAWEKSFRSVGNMRGVGWAMLYYDPEGQSLYNGWVNEHDANIPAQSVPLLLMDVWEHAFMVDYDTKRDGYIDAFMRAIRWKLVNNRFELAAREPASIR